jgi:hypothetical protein
MVERTRIELVDGNLAKITRNPITRPISTFLLVYGN